MPNVLRSRSSSDWTLAMQRWSMHEMLSPLLLLLLLPLSLSCLSCPLPPLYWFQMWREMEGRTAGRKGKEGRKQPHRRGIIGGGNQEGWKARGATSWHLFPIPEPPEFPKLCPQFSCAKHPVWASSCNWGAWGIHRISMWSKESWEEGEDIHSTKHKITARHCAQILDSLEVFEKSFIIQRLFITEISDCLFVADHDSISDSLFIINITTVYY